MAEWLTVEVLDGAEPASSWRRAYEDGLVEAAVTQGARYWEWHDTRWGVVLEVAFDDDDRLERFRALPAVRAALDAVPDPLAGLLVYRGRGGGAGAAVPRRPRPRPVAGAAALPPPEPELPARVGSEPPARDDDPDEVASVPG
ncbi:hypothetical protein SAMN04488107_1287 [Geodermatophilus saharensis]|uniref:Antibiotic biosynthesis monooxygenase n=1 Tax=Geodermatophilus saharensis TaxID=1137994 RepID=A0A239BP16_9ACTN|nr:hypothetical protein [Geodermatophilus saharensis]SNS08784.1 hypothetical protein SAMN04488107_1287 [Geodermatophilus saharensis]